MWNTFKSLTEKIHMKNCKNERGHTHGDNAVTDQVKTGQIVQIPLLYLKTKR